MKRIVIGAVVAMSLSGCAATTDTGGSTSGSQAGDSSPTKSASGPTRANAGVKFGNWKLIGRIQLKDDGLGDYGGVFRVKNVSSAADRGAFTVTVLKGQNIWGTLTCATSNVAPKSIGTAQCSSTDKFKAGWSKLTIENAF